MACEEGTVEERNGGKFKCVGGRWVRLTRTSPSPGTGPGALIVVDHAEILNSPEIMRAIEDPEKQVIVEILEVTDEEEP